MYIHINWVFLHVLYAWGKLLVWHYAIYKIKELHAIRREQIYIICAERNLIKINFHTTSRLLDEMMYYLPGNCMPYLPLSLKRKVDIHFKQIFFSLFQFLVSKFHCQTHRNILWNISRWFEGRKVNFTCSCLYNQSAARIKIHIRPRSAETFFLLFDTISLKLFIYASLINNSVITIESTWEQIGIQY